MGMYWLKKEVEYMVKLTWWNQQTYNEVKKFVDKYGKCAIVQACGTGKSSIIMKLLEDYRGEKKIILAPRDDILNKSYEENPDWNGENTMLLTYSGLLNIVKNGDVSQFDGTKLIIADELHRTGAKQWGVAFELLLELCKGAVLVGATATPRRFDQGKGAMDQVDVYFGGHSAGNLSLIHCIDSGILPRPIYVASMYALEEEINKRLKKLQSNKISAEDKAHISETLNGIRVNWEKLYSVKSILAKHLDDKIQQRQGAKILVFCKNIAHIKDVRKSMDKTFAELFVNASKFTLNEYHSKTSRASFEKFCEQNEPNEVKVLYSVDKFNEGVHVNDLDAVVLLRQTKSEIIYQQQIGRVLSIGGSENPIIFDLVNNFNSVRNLDIWKNAEMNDDDKRSNNAVFRTPYENGDDNMHFFDNTIEIREAFKRVDAAIESSMKYELNDGFSGSLYAIADHYDISAIRLIKRVDAGEPVQQVVNSLVKEANQHCYGVDGSLAEIAKIFKINRSLIIYRMNRGMTVEEAVSYNRPNFDPKQYVK
jgi:superfamily II DNA or RNA helicase